MNRRRRGSNPAVSTRKLNSKQGSTACCDFCGIEKPSCLSLMPLFEETLRKVLICPDCIRKVGLPRGYLVADATNSKSVKESCQKSSTSGSLEIESISRSRSREGNTIQRSYYYRSRSRERRRKRIKSTSKSKSRSKSRSRSRRSRSRSTKSQG